MPTIKNIGKQQRMVVDRYLIPGGERYLSPKQAKAYAGDPDFEIVDETPVSGQQLAVSDEQSAMTSEQLPVTSEPVTSDQLPVKKVKRSKKK